MAEKEKRIFAGYYKRYDSKHICVVATAKDYESREDTVIFYYVTYSGKKRLYNNALEKFSCEGQAQPNHGGNAYRHLSILIGVFFMLGCGKGF